MKRIRAVLTLILCSLFLVLIVPGYAQQYSAGYSVAKEEVFRKIPVEYINKAGTEFVIAYQHSSHGTHVTRGMYGLQDYKPGDTLLYGVSINPVEDKLYIIENKIDNMAEPGVYVPDLSTDETGFIQATRNYLDAVENGGVNVVMWAWCNIGGHDVSGNYLPGMNSLIAEYGEGGSKIGSGAGQRALAVKFIFMTGHANVDANTGAGNPRDQAILINNHSTAIAEYCLDYYSIDSHAMDDTYYEDAGDDGNSATYGGNYYVDWQNDQMLGEDYFENKETPGGIVNYGAHNTQHITANRKAYAMWWILARMAGWDGDTSTVVPVTSIELNSLGDVSEIFTGDTLRFTATVLPETNTNPELTWRVIDGSGSAIIDTTGLLTATNPGSVTVVATARDSSHLSGSFSLSIISPVISVNNMEVSSTAGVTELASGDELQFSVVVLPVDASNKEIDWSVINGTGTAVISQGGLLAAGNPGSVAIVARAKDGTFVSDTFYLTITLPVIPVSGITVTPAGGVTSLVSGSELHFSAAVLPENASNRDVDWSIFPGTGSTFINSTGILSAGNPGTVTVIATTRDGSGITDSILLTITAPVELVSSITVNSEGDVVEMETGASLQFSAVALPVGANNTELDWSVSEVTGTATIIGSGFLTAGNPGTVKVVAAARDGSGVIGTFDLSISTPSIEVGLIEITSEGDMTNIVAGEMLQLFASVSPSDALNLNVLWNVTSTTESTGLGTITEDGMFIALAAGYVDVVAMAQDGSGVFDKLTLTVLGPTAIKVNTSETLKLYPNPGRDLFYLDTGDLDVERVQVVNVVGTVVHQYIPGPGEQLIELNLSREQSGLYFIKVSTGDHFLVKRAIINR